MSIRKPKAEIVKQPDPTPIAMTPFTLHGIEQAEQLADRLSKSGLIPAALRGKPDDILVVLMHGHELGFTPMRSLTGLYVIDGRIGMYADEAVAMIQSHPDVCLYFKLIESTKNQATYETKRAGDPEATRMTWTLEQAQRAGLLSKGPWKQYQETMLRHRCAFALGRERYPDLLRNIYDREDEMDEMVNITPIPPPKVIPMQPRIIQEPASRTTIEQPKAPEPPPAAPAPTQAPAAAQEAPKPGDFSEPKAEAPKPESAVEDINAIFKRLRDVCVRLNWKPTNIDNLIAGSQTIEQAKDTLFRAEAKLAEIVAQRPDGGQETGPDAKGADSAG